jgi:hypothetical protein
MTKLKQKPVMKEQLNGQSQNTLYAVESQDKQKLNSELIKQTEIENTPFTLIEMENGKFISMGQYRLTEVHEPEKPNKELIKEVTKMSWNRITQVFLIIQEQYKNININSLNKK